MDWKKSFISEVKECSEFHLLKWAEIIEELGVESAVLQEYTRIIKSNVIGLYEDMIDEVINMKSAVGCIILQKLQECEALCKELSIQMPEYGKHNLSLYQEHNLLAENIKT